MDSASPVIETCWRTVERHPWTSASLRQLLHLRKSRSAGQRDRGEHWCLQVIVSSINVVTIITYACGTGHQNACMHAPLLPVNNCPNITVVYTCLCCGTVLALDESIWARCEAWMIDECTRDRPRMHSCSFSPLIMIRTHRARGRSPSSIASKNRKSAAAADQACMKLS